MLNGSLAARRSPPSQTTCSLLGKTDTVRIMTSLLSTTMADRGAYSEFVRIWGSHRLSAGMPSLPNLGVLVHVNFFILVASLSPARMSGRSRMANTNTVVAASGSNKDKDA
ncbi:hypothetical protein PHLCEN_2v1967 [Hermanssonia centrifuga]|uniref:Uncharacterized protein n=1 Tax=Hermanssonia centrifuga TaxID=98765 RepID=A0A2R6RVD1_9APHY|nr:hypothetical protein PHLCEN_2v1967 [Hermanssonia centrifuga]